MAIYIIIGNSLKREAMLKLFKNVLTFLQQMTFNYFQAADIFGYIRISITYEVFQLEIRTFLNEMYSDRLG